MTWLPVMERALIGAVVISGMIYCLRALVRYPFRR
jgi:hypothetical protein